MQERFNCPALGISVTVAPADPPAVTVPLSEVRAMRATLAELTAILEALSASDGSTTIMLRSALSMARHVAARLAAAGGGS